MNKIFTSLLLLAGFFATAQVKIGDNPTTIGSSSLLELESSSKALVITRVANTSAVANPVNGMIVYDISSQCFKGYQNGEWSGCGMTQSATASILAQIGAEADNPDIVPSQVSAAQLYSLGVTSVVPAYEGAYQNYIDAHPNDFSSPATMSEVQAMITAVNAEVTDILTQIGNEGDNPDTIVSIVTVEQLEDLGITGITPGYEVAYQDYIDNHPDAFGNPASIAQIQALVTTVNNTVTGVLAQIGNEGDSPDTINSVVTATQLQSIGITGVTPANETAYQEYIDTHPNDFSSPATLSEIQAMVTAVNDTVNDVLAQIGNEGDSPDTINSVVTTVQLQSIGITDVTPGNETAYQEYIDTHPNNFSDPATLAEIQAMVTAVNDTVTDVLAQIGAEGDSPDTINSVVTTTQLISVGITGVTPGNEVAYQEYIDTYPNNFSSPATLSEIQAMVTAVNDTVTDVLAQIGAEGDSPDSINSVVTAAQLQSIGVTGVTPGNETAYQEYIDTHPNDFSDPATLSEIQAMVTAVNSTVNDVLAQIGAEGDNPDTINSVVTTAQLQSIGVTGVTPGNEVAYQEYIDTYSDNFSDPATLSEIQAMVTAVNASAATSGGTATVSGFNCNTASAGTMEVGTVVSGVTQTITATVSTAGTYAITTTNNGVTFSATGTFAGTGPQSIVLTASGTPTVPGSNNFTLNTTPGCSFSRTVTSPSSGGTAVVSGYNCNTASAGTMNINVGVSGVTQTISATVTTLGTYNITTSANGVTFSGSGTFAGTGPQNIILTASGTPNAAGTPSFTLNTTPGCSFTRTITNNPYITALNCAGASIDRYLSSGFSSAGTSITVPYSGGNGVAYTSQTANSTGITGVTATLTVGTLASGAGSIVYTLTGTPSGAGTATFNFSLGGQSCTFSTTVYTGAFTSITNASSPAIDYNIRVNVNSNYFIGPYGNNTANNTGLILHTSFTTSSRKWNFVDAGGGQYAIYNPASGRVADVVNQVANNNVGMQLYDSNETAATGVNQRFTLNAISGSVFGGGTISIRPAQNTSKCWDIVNYIVSNDTPIQIYSYNNGNPAQVFTLSEAQNLVSGVAISSYGVTFGYLGGNTGTYPAQSIASTGVTGLTATLAAGSFGNSSALRFIRFAVSGTPSGSGTASFPVFIGGQAFTFNLTVQ